MNIAVSTAVATYRKGMGVYNMLSEKERLFIKLLENHKPAVASLKDIPKDDPSRAEKFMEYNNGQRETKEIISALADMVNPFGFNANYAIEEIKQSAKAYENLVQLAYEWVDLWYNCSSSFSDERNIASTVLCREIAGAILGHDGFIADRKEYAGLETAVFQMHKSLAQRATIIFAKVLYEENRSARTVIKSRYNGNDVRLPYI